GAGVFLHSLGQEWEKYAVEGSELTRRDLEANGIKVFRELSSAAESEAGTFQVITIYQVLEHIADFRPVLAQCHQLLCKGGQLVITVPSGEAMIAQEKLTGCPDMPPSHINKWSPDSLSRVLRKAGFVSHTTIFEPPSWENLKTALYLRVIADSTNPYSVAAQFYRIKNKKLRAPLLAGLGISAFIRMFPNIRKLRQGGSFAMISIAD
ncbi:MAG: class I SAM-dependent methyltransferase, partial [Moorea sp. SIO3C2]|nr:class I SAM-dependent methyltransferase [Moorena sp. SIO3C2]